MDHMTLLIGKAGLLGLGAGLAVLGGGVAAIGAGLGIGRVGGEASAALARQPQAGDQITRNMLISAVMIEGVAIFVAVTAFLTYTALTGKI